MMDDERTDLVRQVKSKIEREIAKAKKRLDENIEACYKEKYLDELDLEDYIQEYVVIMLFQKYVSAPDSFMQTQHLSRDYVLQIDTMKLLLLDDVHIVETLIYHAVYDNGIYSLGRMFDDYYFEHSFFSTFERCVYEKDITH